MSDQIEICTQHVQLLQLAALALIAMERSASVRMHVRTHLERFRLRWLGQILFIEFFYHDPLINPDMSPTVRNRHLRDLWAIYYSSYLHRSGAHLTLIFRVVGPFGIEWLEI